MKHDVKFKKIKYILVFDTRNYFVVFSYLFTLINSKFEAREQGGRGKMFCPKRRYTTIEMTLIINIFSLKGILLQFGYTFIVF